MREAPTLTRSASRWLTLLLSLSAVVLHAAGCRSGSAAQGSTTSSSGEPPVGVGDVVEADIGPEGGTITSADGVAELEIPPGALTATVRFRIGPATNAPPGSLIQPYSIEPSGTTFARPAILSLRSPSITDTEEEAPRVAVDEGGRWSTLPGGSWVPDANGVTGHLHHLSTYGVVQRFRGRSMREEDDAEPGAPTCRCLPEERKTCCIESNGRYLEPCSCEHSYSEATLWKRHDELWLDHDCLTEKGMLVPTPNGACALECCRSMPGIPLFTDGSNLVCQYSVRWLRSFEACIEKCPAWEAPYCRGGEYVGPDAGPVTQSDAGSGKSDASTGCPFTGSWSGTYGGAGSGSWEAVVDTACQVTGTHSGTSPDGPVNGGISGTIEVDGTLALKAAFGAAACPWEGTASQSTASGTWSCGPGITGTWSGSRKGP